MDTQNNTAQVIKYRRVGTITMGFVLILTGSLLLLSLFSNTFDYTKVFRFSPIILVALGIEILIQLACVKDGKIKYDIISMFLCGILVIGSLGLSVAFPFLKYVSPERERIQTEIRYEFEQEIANRLDALSFVQNVNTVLSLDFAFPDDSTLKTIDTYCEYAAVNIELNEGSNSKEEFAKFADQIRIALKEVPISNMNITIQSKVNEAALDGQVEQYVIDMNSTYSKNKTQKQMVSAVRECIHISEEEQYVYEE